VRTRQHTTTRQDVLSRQWKDLSKHECWRKSDLFGVKAGILILTAPVSTFNIKQRSSANLLSL
jgi:hypothetical protein